MDGTDSGNHVTGLNHDLTVSWVTYIRTDNDVSKLKHTYLPFPLRSFNRGEADELIKTSKDNNGKVVSYFHLRPRDWNEGHV